MTDESGLAPGQAIDRLYGSYRQRPGSGAAPGAAGQGDLRRSQEPPDARRADGRPMRSAARRAAVGVEPD